MLLKHDISSWLVILGKKKERKDTGVVGSVAVSVVVAVF